MNKNLRLKINSSIEQRIVSKNLIILCIAKLYYGKIQISNTESKKEKEQLLKLAECAKDNGIEVGKLQSQISKISEIDFPTIKNVNDVYEIVLEEEYDFVEDYIPDSYLHKRTEEEKEQQRKKVEIKKQNDEKKKEEEKKESEEFEKLCEFVATKIVIRNSLTPAMREKLKHMKTEKYNYGFIHYVFLFYGREIVNISKLKHFESEVDWFYYMCGIAKKFYLRTEDRLEERRRQKELFERIDLDRILYTGGAEYQKQEKKVSPAHQKFLDEMWNKR